MVNLKVVVVIILYFVSMTAKCLTFVWWPILKLLKLTIRPKMKARVLNKNMYKN